MTCECTRGMNHSASMPCPVPQVFQSADSRARFVSELVHQGTGLVADCDHHSSPCAGQQHVVRCDLAAAVAAFSEAAALLPPKTEEGGNAMLQQAIALDSMGKSEDALPIYRRLLGHRNASVARTVRALP